MQLISLDFHFMTGLILPFRFTEFILRMHHICHVFNHLENDSSKFTLHGVECGVWDMGVNIIKQVTHGLKET